MQSSTPGDAPMEQPPLFLAAEYVRMSTEHQQYSTNNQADKIREYAAQRGIQIVRTYGDEGKSGLSINGRPALQRLISDVESGEADFQIILVYDVSRWGRFQDADESAYYEYRCRRAGIRIEYCAEQFENDGSPISTIVKGVKRAMAGEYSRELSSKVFAGQCRLIELGYHQGSYAGYGLRRVLIDQHGAIKCELGQGEHKSIQTDRIILKPGPEEEIRIVTLIYHWVIDEDLSESAIARRLNKMSIRSDQNRNWTRDTVLQVLTNEKYIGNNVYNRISKKLRKLRVFNPPEMWIKKEGAFEAVVSSVTFYKVQDILQARRRKYTDEELIERLRALYQNRGHLSVLIINETEGMPSTDVYQLRFGSLARAYELVGFNTGRDCHALETNRLLRRLHPEIIKETERTITSLGGMIQRDLVTDLLTINNEFSVSLVLVRCQTSDCGYRRWKIRFDTSLAPDITVAVRLDQANRKTLDYYLLPRLDFGQPRIVLADQNTVEFDCYRFDNLDFFFGMAERTPLRRAA